MARPGAVGRTPPVYCCTCWVCSWTIKARVTSKGDIRTWKNARGEGKLFSCDLLDGEAWARSLLHPMLCAWDARGVGRVTLACVCEPLMSCVCVGLGREQCIGAARSMGS